MDLLQAALLGLVEGLTEYLPVSSTGHLILAERALGIPRGEAADAFAIVIQSGAIVAVLVLYGRRVLQILRGLVGRDPAGLRLAFHLVCAFLPAAVFGLLFESTIKERLFQLPAVAGAWLVGGVAILLAERWRRWRGESGRAPRALDELRWSGALLIGVAQAAAMWPGTSRSLVAILGGLFVGLSLPAAVEFSFLLGVVTLGAATAKDAWSHGATMLDAYGAANLVVGFVVATVSAALAVRWMVGFVTRRGMSVFGWYRIGLAAVVAGLLWAGHL